MSILQRTRLFELSKTPKAIESPSSLDLAWAAGIYEGEGHCRNEPNSRGFSSERVVITQKDTWILYRFQRFFGGKVRRINKGHGNYCHCWEIFGTRGRGFLMTIYFLLSPRRQQQINALGFLNLPAKVAA